MNIPNKLPTNSQNYGSEVKLELVRIKVDEIISYLQAKEDKSYKTASSVCCDSSFRLEGDNKEGTMFHVCNNCSKACDIELTEKKVEASKKDKYLCYTCNQWGIVGEHECEASKGECKNIECLKKKVKKNIIDHSHAIYEELDPPESKGECTCSYYDWDRGVPNKKCLVHNPPEHEEIEDDPEYHEVMSELKTRDFIYKLVDDIGSQVTRDYEEKNGIWEGMSVGNAKSAEKCIRNFDKLFTEYVSKEKIKEYVSDKLNCYSNPDYRVALKDLSESLGLGE